MLDHQNVVSCTSEICNWFKFYEFCNFWKFYMVSNLRKWFRKYDIILKYSKMSCFYFLTCFLSDAKNIPKTRSLEKNKLTIFCWFCCFVTPNKWTSYRNIYVKFNIGISFYNKYFHIERNVNLKKTLIYFTFH